MDAHGIRGRVGRLVNLALRPLGVSIHRRAVVDRARRATYAGALAHVKRLGFAPRTVIDVGLADGTPALYEAYPDARHVLIEPVEEARPYLEALARRYPKVEYVIAAAARYPGSVKINVHRDIARSSLYWESDYTPDSVTPREVAAVTLDQVRRERELAPPILLKIDVQGAELEVLAGATETLRDTEYVVLETSLFEFFPGAPLVAEIVDYMRRHGFVIYDVLALQYRPLDGAMSMLDLAFVKSAGAFRRVHRFQPLTDT